MVKELAEGAVYISERGGVTFHTYVSPVQGLLVCSHVIESTNALVVVDALMLRPHYTELRAYADSLGKPIDRVIVSHLHPDHWFGLEAFDDVPVHAQQYCRDGIVIAGDTFLGTKRTVYGDLVPSRKVVPTDIVTPGTSCIDGLTYEFSEVTEAESTIALVIELPEVKTLVAQDLVYNHVHMFVGEKTSAGDYCCDNWMEALSAYQAKGHELILPGHGEPCGPEAFSEAITYLREVKELLRSATGEEDLKRRTMERFPGYRVPEILDLTNLFLYHRTW
ncbi:MAG: MBL fold metallo-hydrolase [Gemmatimonadetes bacterium]|nr:MBL fold metallo-hydrolase [Gemmatimonadota bacterium]